MAPWLLAALRMLGAAAGFGVGAELAERALDRDVQGTFASTPSGGFLGLGGGADGGGRRRRRRRALTQGDRDDIAFITGMLGAPAGKQFALTLAGRSR